jgi:hypothetical protein
MASSSLLLDNKNKNKKNEKELLLLDAQQIKKIELATEGLHGYIYRELIEEVSRENAIVIANYILTQKRDINLADTYRKTIINGLIILSKFLKSKSFKYITRDEFYFIWIVYEGQNH